MQSLEQATQLPTSVLERRPDESEFEHHRRIIEGKLGDGTLSDYDYAELSKYALGKEYSADNARRMFYGCKRTLDCLHNSGIEAASDGAVLSEIDSRMAELQKERQKFYDQRREYNKLLSHDGRKEHLYDTLAKAANQLSESVGAMYTPDWLHEDGLKLSFSETEAVLVLSDWHYGLVADNIFNTYNTAICKDRVRAVVANAIDRINLHRCAQLHIVILGDLFHGAIHTNARVASEELVCDQLMQVSEILAQSIMELSQYVEETTVYMTYGNHARTVQNKNDSIHRDNMERIIPWWLEQRFKGYNNIHIAEASENEFIFVNSFGFNIAAAHGDLDSVRQSTRLIPLLFQKIYGKDVQYVILGDKHHRESYNELGVTAVICGSLCGADDYANDKRLFSEPSQLLLITSPECGVDAEYHLKCK